MKLNNAAASVVTSSWNKKDILHNLIKSWSCTKWYGNFAQRYQLDSSGSAARGTYQLSGLCHGGGIIIQLGDKATMEVLNKLFVLERNT